MRGVKLLGMFVLVFAQVLWAQSTDNGEPHSATESQHQKHHKGGSVAGDLGGGAGDVGKGAAKGAGYIAGGTARGVGDVITLHPISGATAVGKGAAKGGKNIVTGAAKGTAKVGKAIGKIF